MSVRMEFAAEKPDYAIMERGYWQQTTVSRAREDAKMDADYRARRDKYRGHLVDLYNRKSQLQNDLQSLEASISFQEQEQERLAHEYEETRTRIRTQRERDDARQQEVFYQVRERDEEAKKEIARPKSIERPPAKENMPLPPVTAPVAPPAHVAPVAHVTPVAHVAHVAPVSAAAAAASGGWTSINGAARRRTIREEDDEPPADPGNLLGSVYHNPVDESEVNGHGHGMIRNGSVRPHHPPTAPNGISIVEEDNPHVQARKNGERPLKPKQRHSLPTFTSVVRSPVGKPTLMQELPPIQTKSRSPSGRKSLPEGKRSTTPVKEEPEVNDGKEINRENLIIKNDGRVITEPAMYAGIPLEKIHERHEYWDPEWQPLDGLIKPLFDGWKVKLARLKSTPEAVRHAVFLANRQVNRGQQIMDFLNNETVGFHPYQFVGKEMMKKWYKNYINYDTMFRLANIHEELKKFDLDVTPLDWLRHRIWEVADAQGARFNFTKYVHDLYHDAKLKTLREKHGFGNIGRPSGFKLGERDPNKGSKPKVKRESTGTGSTRKKGRRSIGQVDPDGVMSIPEMNGFYPQQHPQEVLEPVTPRLQKRQRVEAALPPQLPPPPPPPEPEDDLDFTGYTSTDSFSKGRIMHLDWRVNQIKTPHLTTNALVTQYWTWKSDQNMFEHQVLRDVAPRVTWGFYQKPIDFSLKLNDLIEVRYSSDSQKIVAVVKEKSRGDILANFKRERTKKRFLAFVKKKGVKLVRGTGPQLEEAWANMESEILPHEESDH